MAAKKLIVGNWKMNPKSRREASRIWEKISKGVSRFKKINMVVCPPFPFLPLLKGKMQLGAQNIFFEKEGAYTGEVSPPMLKSLGVGYVIVGHSERRALGDTEDIVNKKLKAALSSGLTPILCVGERERDLHSHYLHLVKDQLKSALKGIQKNKIGKIVIAYEPVWAIGKSAKGVLDADEALHMNIFIRKVISDIAGEGTARKIKVLYGGSVDVKNSAEFLRVGKMDGLLVGRESLSPKNFLEIIRNANTL